MPQEGMQLIFIEKKNQSIVVFLFLCYVFLGVCGFSLVAASGVYSRVAVRGLLIAVASLV